MIKYSTNNSKLVELAKMLNLKRSQVVSFDLPAGFTCPCADLCKSFANPRNGKITDGKSMIYRCYATNAESRFKAVREMRWGNYNALKNSNNMVELINNSIPNNVKVIRIHSSGDFFNQEYFNAWVRVAELNPNIQFFGYTKVLPYVKAYKPNNFKLVYSYGGKMDSQLTDEPTAYIVKNITEAVQRGLKTACQILPADDFNFVINGATFALALHGVQPAKR